MSTVRSRRVGRLPAEWTSFVGRRAELADARRMVNDHRLVTLTGVAGVGKSRLARRVADQVVRMAPGGIWWVELDHVTEPGEVPRAVAETLDLPGTGGADPVAALVEYLADRTTVLVLDNCEHLVAACAGLAGTLLRETDGVRILATSREVLGVPGEHVLAVQPLRVPPRRLHELGQLTGYPSVALFCQRAVAAVPGFTLTAANETAVAGICRRVDGLPLAIELAALRLRALSPEQLLRRLDDQLDVLVTGPRTASARQRTLRGALEWSYALCSPAEQRVWAEISVFTEGFDLSAAAHVCRTRPEDLTQVLDGLVGKSVLIRAETGGRVRFRLLGAVARYGREKLGPGPLEAALRARHADWYARLAKLAAQAWFGPAEPSWLAWVHAEHGNLRTALDHLLGGGDERALRMVGDLWFYWTHGAATNEAARWLDRVLARFAAPTADRARALWVAGYVAAVRSDTDAALDFLARAEELATALGDPSALGWAASCAAAVAMIREDYAATAAFAQEALARFAVAGEAGAGPVVARLSLASARLLTGDLDGARALAEQCWAVCAVRGELILHGTALLILARAEWAGGGTAAATGYAHAALRLRPTAPRPTVPTPTLTLALDLLGWIAAGAGEYERVAVLYGAFDELRRSLGTAVSARSPSNAREHAEAAARARTALGEAAWARAYGQGAALGTEEIVRYALGEKPRRTQLADGAEPALTARERQIAGLVARGLSNRQIASQLVISQRTAETHIEHVLRKLNFTSRAQIAAWASGPDRPL